MESGSGRQPLGPPGNIGQHQRHGLFARGYLKGGRELWISEALAPASVDR